MVVMFLLYAIHHFWLKRVIHSFQHKTWPRVQNSYRRIITWALVGKRPVVLLIGTFVLMIASFIITGLRKPGVVFFPQAEPNFTYIYITAPVGTSAKFTDSIVKRIENDVFTLTGKNNPIVESVISNVAVGATDPNSGDRSVAGNKGKITVAFVEFSKRGGKSTQELLEKIRKGIKPIAGIDIVVEPERNGPPVGKIVNIEIRGDEFNTLVKTAGKLKTYLDNLQIPGVEELKSDFISSKPEIIVKIDRERANRQGISTAQIGMALRNSIFGAEASKFKDENEDYPIMVRVNKEQSNNLDALLNMKIIYRDMNMGGMLRQVPLSAVATIEYGITYCGINRLNQKRVITLASNALPGYAPNEVVDQVQSAIDNFENPGGVEIIMTGEQEQQKETQSFLGMAMLPTKAVQAGSCAGVICKAVFSLAWRSANFAAILLAMRSWRSGDIWRSPSPLR
jgi:multidrug efflux pump subunit AcrB